MTGRGMDQILPHSCPPRLYEPCVRSALEYVALAEEANGPIPRPADYGYVWGNAAERLEREQPDVRIVNLETSITTSEDAARKSIHYRMHPANVAVRSTRGKSCGFAKLADAGEIGACNCRAADYCDCSRRLGP